MLSSPPPKIKSCWQMRRVISFTFFNLITTDVVCVTKMEVLQMRWNSLFPTHKNCFNKLKKTNSYESVFSPPLEIKVWVGALVGVESCTNMEKYKTDSITQRNRLKNRCMNTSFCMFLRYLAPFVSSPFVLLPVFKTPPVQRCCSADPDRGKRP